MSDLAKPCPAVVLAGLLLVTFLGPAARGQVIDGRIPAPNLRRIERAKRAKPARDVVPAGSSVVVGARIGGGVRRITLVPPDPAEPEPEAEPRDEFDEEPDPPVLPDFGGLNLKGWAVARENFDRILFEGSKGPPRHEHLDEQLLARLDREVQAHQLDREQREKLRLAGLGDIKRLLDRIEATRADFETVRGQPNETTPVLRRVVGLADEYKAGPFGEESLLMKTLRTIQGDRQGPR